MIINKIILKYFLTKIEINKIIINNTILIYLKKYLNYQIVTQCMPLHEGNKNEELSD